MLIMIKKFFMHFSKLLLLFTLIFLSIKVQGDLIFPSIKDNALNGYKYDQPCESENNDICDILEDVAYVCNNEDQSICVLEGIRLLEENGLVVKALGYYNWLCKSGNDEGCSAYNLLDEYIYICEEDQNNCLVPSVVFEYETKTSVVIDDVIIEVLEKSINYHPVKDMPNIGQFQITNNIQSTQNPYQKISTSNSADSLETNKECSGEGDFVICPYSNSDQFVIRRRANSGPFGTCGVYTCDDDFSILAEKAREATSQEITSNIIGEIEKRCDSDPNNGSFNCQNED